MENLRERNICIIDWCCMCKHNGETTEHLLLCCNYVYNLWSWVFCLFGVQRLLPRRVVGPIGMLERGALEDICCWFVRGHKPIPQILELRFCCCCCCCDASLGDVDHTPNFETKVLLIMLLLLLFWCLTGCHKVNFFSLKFSACDGPKSLT